MSRINIVREIRDKNQTKKNNMNLKRELGWNDRFILGKIPDYFPKKKSNLNKYISPPFLLLF